MIKKIALEAKKASYFLAQMDSKSKDKMLREMAQALNRSKRAIMEQNQKDLLFGERSKLSAVMLDRLMLNEDRIEKMAEGVYQVSKLPDPVGLELEKWKRPNGLVIQKRSVPIGLIGMIYESRPNVTADAGSLCFKSGNACLLRGGKEAIHSNKAIVTILQNVLRKNKIPPAVISFIEKTDRKYVDEMLSLSGIIDVIIPRGGKGLIKRVAENSKIPVIKHYDGNCHVYIDQFADLSKALSICLNAKTQKPGVCNAAETFLVHQKIAKKFLPTLCESLKQHSVEIRGCVQTRAIIPVKKATENDFYEEYLDLIVAIKVVGSVQEAVDHINHYGSTHTDAIITKDKKAQKYFEDTVDSSVVLTNASTRFNDGFEFGFGAEIGISTDHLHARGPVGLRELTTYKYIIHGKGQIRK